MIYTVHAEIMKFPIVTVTRRLILDSGLMLSATTPSRALGFAHKPIGVSVASPINRNSNSTIGQRRLDRFTLTEGGLRSPYVWIASVQGVRSSHALTEDTPPSPTPGVPASPRGRIETGACRWPPSPLTSRPTELSGRQEPASTLSLRGLGA